MFKLLYLVGMVAAAATISYLLIGIVKTSWYYYLFYKRWNDAGKPFFYYHYTSVEYDEDGNEMEGTERKEEILCDSPYDFLTWQLREYLLEKMTEEMSSTLAHDFLHHPSVKKMNAVIQFLSIDVLMWPKSSHEFWMPDFKNLSR